MRRLAAIYVTAILWFSSNANAFDFNSSYYSVYEQPGTGNTTIIYLVPRSMSVLLSTSSTSVPLSFMAQTTGFQTVLYPDGSLGTFTQVNYTANNMAALGATLSSYQLNDGDFYGNKQIDFLLQGSGARNSVVLTTDVNGNTQIAYNFGTQLNSAVYSITTGDLDLDGRWDIIAKNKTTGVSTTYYSNFAGYFDAGAPATGDSTTTLVGAINGTFRVDESGNSTYSVDILASAGTAGVAPHISLNYSSGAGDGVMGTGWSIGGLSAITRCRQTLGQDGNATAITLGASDRFCLDGQRLILTSGTYGAPGSTYRTEIDSYAVITANGGTTGNPSYFTVTRKDGSTSYYGNGNNSQLVLNGNGPVLTWSISRFQDSVGNPIRFSYTISPQLPSGQWPNEQLISRIDYAYGSNTTATSNSTTYLSFNYAARPDASNGYIAGSKIQRTQRLASIYSYNNGAEIRHYSLAYRTTDSTHYQSYVQQLFECAGSSCLSPTTFNWNLNNGGFQSAGTTVATINSSAQLNLRNVDINGDGKPDLVYRLDSGASPYNYYYQLWNGSSYSAPVQFATYPQSGFNVLIQDQNNDGYLDLLVGATSTNWHLYRGGANGLTDGGDTGIPFATYNYAAMDINSDGLVDYVEVSNTPSITYRLSQRTNSNGQWTYAFGASQAATFNLGSPGCQFNVVNLNTTSTVDFNGDGNVDLPTTVGYNAGILNFTCVAATTLVGNGSGAFTATPWMAGAGTAIQYINYTSRQFVDLNGDGLPDMVWGDTTASNRQYAFNTGGALGAATVLDGSVDFSKGPVPLIFADYNNDGYPDAVYASTTGGNLSVRLYNPSTQTYGAPSTTLLPSTCNNFIDADGDGNVDALCVQNNGSSNVISLYKSADTGSVGNKITSIDNGLGNTTSITYKPLTDTSVYTKAHDANDATKWPGAPVFDIVAPSYVVSSVSSTAPTANATNPNQVNYGATVSVSYQYGGLKMQASGRGSLGFASITTTDNQSLVKTKTTYNQTFPFIGQPLQTTLTSSANVVFKTNNNTQASVTQTGADGTKYYQVYTPTVTEQTKDPIGGQELSYVVTQTIAPDAWGNVTGSVSSPGIVVTTYASNHATIVKQMSTYNAYGSTAYEQQFSRLSSSTVTHIRPGQSNITRTSNFTYYGSGDGNLQGLLKTEQVTTPDGSASAITTYQYDAFGNKKCASTGSDTNTASNCTPSTSNRYSITDYDSAGRFVVDKQSAFNSNSGWVNMITEQVVSRNALGLPTQVNGLNGIVSNYTYDALGREASRSDNTGAALTTTYARYGVSGAQYNVTTTANTGATATQYFDALGRSIAKWQRGFDGTWITSETEYDNVSRVKRQSAPHNYGAAAYWATNNYDAFRLQNQIAPATGGATSTTSMTYGMIYGLSLTTITNALNQTRVEARNAAGELFAVQDHLGGYINYTYDAAGQLIQTATTGTQNGASTTINTYLDYDQLGRKIKMRDSDKGTWFYVYNSFGDLTDQYKVMSSSNYTGTLAQALADNAVQLQHTHMDYDKRGRLTARSDYRETRPLDSVVESTSTWAYDTSTNGIGQLFYEIGGGLTRAYAYDSLGRPSQTLHADGNSYYLLTVAYDSYGRPYKNTDALGTGSGTQNSYNSFGYLQSVSDIATNNTLYSVQNMDARGNVTSAILGNGATSSWTYDQGSGLLTNQTTANVLGVTLQRLDYTWDVLGNQTSRYDRGIQSGTTYKNLQQSFCYDGLNRLIKTNQGSLNGSCAGTQDQQYDGFGGITTKTNVGTYTYNSAHAHQLQSTGDGVSYTYDNVGNLTADTSGRALHYTVFDKADVVSKGSNQITYAYGPDRNYYKRIDSTSSGTSTTYYIGNIEKVVKSDGSYDMKRYVADVALWNHHFNSGGTQTSVDQQYMYKDALGSVVLITDGVGAVKQQLAYNSWGERVDNTDWQSVLPGSNFIPVSQQFTTHSFTGQDALDAVGLINYGGRIYDERLSRFIQADPIVQDGMDSQAYNRYAYVRNNPLTLTDPSGFCSDLNPSCALKHVSNGASDAVSGAWHGLTSALHPVTKAAGYAVAHVHDFETRWTGEQALLRAIDPRLESMVLAYGSKFCGPYAAACEAVGTYDIAIAHGASINDAAKAGAIAGASAYAFSQVNGYYGDSWSAGRVVATATVGGATSAASGGGFERGFINAGVPALLSWGNYSMRQEMVQQSQINPQNSDGLSEGFYGDGTKLAGARAEGSVFCNSLMGGCQGAVGEGRPGISSSFFGYQYSPGSVPDTINESFAGPHDWLRNLTGSYDSMGNSIHVEGMAAMWDSAKNYALVIPAAPFAIGGMLETHLNANVALSQKL